MTTRRMTDADLADYYNSTRDLSEFDGGEVVSSARQAQPETRSVTISVRFSPSELARVEKLAHAAGMRLTAFIRAAALATEEPPVDRAEVLDLLTALRQSVEGTTSGRPGEVARAVYKTNRAARTAARSAIAGRFVSGSSGTLMRLAASKKSSKSTASKGVARSSKSKGVGRNPNR